VERVISGREKTERKLPADRRGGWKGPSYSIGSLRSQERRGRGDRPGGLLKGLGRGRRGRNLEGRYFKFLRGEKGLDGKGGGPLSNSRGEPCRGKRRRRQGGPQKGE